MSEPADGNRYTTSGLGRALAVIDLLAEGSPEMIGVSTVARELNLPKAVAHRILKELTANQFVTFDEGTRRYRLGPGALAVGLAALRAIDVQAITNRHMRRLVEATGETATLSMRQGWIRVYTDQVLSPHEIRMSVTLGSRHSLSAGSSSKAILAALPDAEVDEYLATHELTSMTPATITSVEQLRDDLRAVRQQGYAVSRGERQAGAASVAAAIRLASGEVYGSLSLCGPADRFSSRLLAEYGELVSDAARQVSAELGYLPAQEQEATEPEPASRGRTARRQGSRASRDQSATSLVEVVASQK
ncbi:IclR family transcriptional regulator [Micromonospora sp. NBRC 101691]|uniref:IclR family transcriptional regulator n=1 Tax=Micromonospora sp. NBRC 101691 TaxID=3032198 RepID=UPI0025532F6C|nr:IclR family transcriptional regulator [Micromonospora sp. NBRC 101691]